MMPPYRLLIILTSIAVLVLFIYLIGYYLAMRHIKEPSYKCLNKDGSIELRQYQPMIVAEVDESGDRDNAVRNGFQALAGYIFGNNKNSDNASVKIQMTAPVLQQSHGLQKWQVRFVMPKHYTLSTLPKPSNPNIRISQLPSKRYIVIKFSGAITSENINRHLVWLREYIAAHQLNVVGQPIYAFYNPPWTLPIMRRNEVMFELISP